MLSFALVSYEKNKKKLTKKKLNQLIIKENLCNLNKMWEFYSILKIKN